MTKRLDFLLIAGNKQLFKLVEDQKDRAQRLDIECLNCFQWCETGKDVSLGHFLNAFLQRNEYVLISSHIKSLAMTRIKTVQETTTHHGCLARSGKSVQQQ